MALLRIGGFNLGRQREELLASYEGEEPYMPGGYETPYDGEEPWMPEDRRGDDGDYDDGYDGDGYDDGDYADDGYGGDYDPGYDDEPYYGGGSRYDDDYGYDEANGYDEDGDYPPEDRYDRPPYYDAPEYAGEAEYPEGAWGELLRYMDGHDWVTWLLLALLPPAGIWLLWRRRRYGQGASVALTALSGLWLAAALVLLIAKPFRPAGDTTITPQPVGAPLPTQEIVEEAPAEPVSSVVSAEEVDEANAVYVAADAPYYHQSNECAAIPQDSELSRIGRNTAIENSLMACPYCIAGQYSDGLWDLVYVTADSEDLSGMRVYCSAYNTHFHTEAACSDLGTDAHEVGLKDALLMGKTACEVCCPQAATQVYCTSDGNYYHAEPECSGMRNAKPVTYAEARVTGKKRCPKCIGGTDETEQGAQATGYYVYATAKGTYYHVNSTCSGMRNAEQVLLSEMIKQGRPPCPVCCPDAEALVFAEPGNPYFHSYATCSGMTRATQGILVNALAAGLTRCPVCWTSN